MAKKKVELFLLPIENDDEKRELYGIIDEKALAETVDKSVRVLSLYLEDAKEKFYTVRSSQNPDTYRNKLVGLIDEAVEKWKEQFQSTLQAISLIPDGVFNVEVIGTITYTFKYSPDIQRVLNRDKDVYRIRERKFTPTDDLVSAIEQANNILLKKSNCPTSLR